MVNFLIITHGEFGAYLVEAAEEIVGRQGEGVRVVSISARLSVQEIRKRTRAAIDELYEKAEGLVIVTDMIGGTPANVALPLVKHLSNISIISGANLYMLVSGFAKRKTEPRERIVAAMLRDGQRSIQDIGQRLLSHVHSARTD